MRSTNTLYCLLGLYVCRHAFFCKNAVDLRAILRDPARSFQDLKQAIVDAMDIKPERHYFYDEDYAQPVRLMNMTGG